MNGCLEAIEVRLGDLLQSGLDTGGADAAAAFVRLAEECEACGLHTGSALMARLAGQLEARPHNLKKEDAPLLDALFTAEHYIALCRERWQEIEILQGWQEQQYQEQDREGGDLT